MGFKIKLPKNPIQDLTTGIKNVAQGIQSGNVDPIKKEWENYQRNIDPGFRYLWEPLGEKAVKPPGGGEDPNVTALRSRLYGEAGKFLQDMPGLQKAASSQIEQEGSLAEKSGIKRTRQNYNRRGLLYSGLREAGEQGVRGQVASTMAQQKAQSNKELTDMAQAKVNKAAQAGLQGYQDSVNREAEIAGINLQNQVARTQAMQALGQTVGYGAGTYLGSRSSQPAQAQPSQPTYSGFQGDYNYNQNRAYA